MTLSHLLPDLTLQPSAHHHNHANVIVQLPWLQHEQTKPVTVQQSHGKRKKKKEKTTKRLNRIKPSVRVAMTEYSQNTSSVPHPPDAPHED